MRGNAGRGRIKKRHRTGLEARMLPLCYAAPLYFVSERLATYICLILIIETICFFFPVPICGNRTLSTCGDLKRRVLTHPSSLSRVSQKSIFSALMSTHLTRYEASTFLGFHSVTRMDALFESSVLFYLGPCRGHKGRNVPWLIKPITKSTLKTSVKNLFMT